MKKIYVEPRISTMEFQAVESIAANPIDAATMHTSGGDPVTIYDVSLFVAASYTDD